jgi:hypothetical protein
MALGEAASLNLLKLDRERMVRPHLSQIERAVGRCAKNLVILRNDEAFVNSTMNHPLNGSLSQLE